MEDSLFTFNSTCGEGGSGGRKEAASQRLGSDAGGRGTAHHFARSVLSWSYTREVEARGKGDQAKEDSGYTHACLSSELHTN